MRLDELKFEDQTPNWDRAIVAPGIEVWRQRASNPVYSEDTPYRIVVGEFTQDRRFYPERNSHLDALTTQALIFHLLNPEGNTP